MRRLALAAALAAAALVGTTPASAQTPDFSGTLVVSPATTPPSSTATATAVVTPLVDAGPSVVRVTLTNTGGAGTFSIVSATPELTGCALSGSDRIVICSWDVQVADGPQTLVLTINVDAAAVIGSVWALDLGAARVQTPLEPALATATLTIEQLPTTTLPPTTEPPTTGPATTTATTGRPVPTTAENLPSTGGSDAPLFLALAVLAGGAFLLITARKFRETDEA